MQDSEGKGRWIIASLGAVLALALFFTVARGVGTQDSSPVAPPTSVPGASPAAGVSGGLQAELFINQRLDALYDQATVVSPIDEPGQQRLTDDYRELLRLADSEHIRLPNGCRVASRAWQVKAFLLAKEAWDTCYLAGEAGNDYGFYAGVLRNLGRLWAEESHDGRVRYKGLSYLVTCVELVDHLNLGIWECRQDLGRLVGESGWPPAAPSPLLLLRRAAS